MRSNAFIYFAIAAIWAKSYLTQRLAFELPVSGWEQELLMALNPLASVLAMTALCAAAFRRRLSVALIALAFTTSALLFADLVFYRFFNDFITIPVLLQSEHMNDLWSSVLQLTQPTDPLLFADGLLLSLAAARRRFRPAPWNRYRTAAAAGLAAGLLACNYSMAESVRPDLLTRAFDRQILVRSIGAYNYHVYDAVLNARMGSRKALAREADFEEAARIFDELPLDGADPSLFGVAKGRNVFLISLESLQSFMLERRIDGREATPFLNRLMKDSFAFDEFYHQTGQGKTSDAEFLIDTSLFPLPTGAVFFTHAQNVYRTLPMSLKREGYATAAFHANDPSFWNRGRMYPALGYDRFYSVRDYAVNEENRIGWGLNDVSFFEQSVALAAKLPQPFFAKLITLTNHYPFELDEAHRLLPEYTSSSRTLNRYVPTVRYLDQAVERFFEAVKAQGLYERSVFVLYGDHYGISTKHNKAMAQLLGKPLITPYDTVRLQRVPLLIHIPGVPGRRMPTVGGQIDLYPTLLHLLGATPEDRYYFGRDLFAAGRPQFVVFRDGSFVTDRLVYTKNACYDKASGGRIDAAACEPFKRQAIDRLTSSDAIVYGDLFRFIPGADPARKL
ncbi:LTA synthase family protein [Paenibacillus sp.]|uniref:LTA synthase family protein n=1 Tax=Paenibacillus sp. TaxID=58172 RepID=UPI002D5E997E|nr:LTA synthase family protein [Paenibacillus sp.]HZG87678.1 LTA synthase family protein [Paenibacillus sp.]